jgi:hypothetical protein
MIFLILIYTRSSIYNLIFINLNYYTFLKNITTYTVSSISISPLNINLYILYHFNHLYYYFIIIFIQPI